MNLQDKDPQAKGGKLGKRQIGIEKHKSKMEDKPQKKPEEKAKPQDANIPDLQSGKLSLIQSNHGIIGNFELVVPLAKGGLACYSRQNDLEGFPWDGPVIFGTEEGRMEGSSLIMSNFGFSGNLEVVAVDSGGRNLLHFWRDSGPSYDWHGPIRISEKSLVQTFSGSPAMIKSNFGRRGNFDVVVPRDKGGFYHYWRDNDDPALTWNGPFKFATDKGRFDEVTLIQSNFGDPGNLEMVARYGDKLAFFWRDFDQDSKWNGPEIIARGVAGTPSMIQSTFGSKGNFELVVPLESGGLAYYWRDNDDGHLRWMGPLMFGMRMGLVESVALIQSNFGDPGHLEMAALTEGQLALFWRDSGPDFRWNGPQYLTFERNRTA